MTITPRPLARRQRGALRDLVDADRLPGQPAVTSAAAEALAGRSPVDGGWWAELGRVHVDVIPGPGETLAGAVSWAIRPRDDTAVLLWLHARGQPAVVAALVDHALARHDGPWHAFGFAGRVLWRYLHRPLTDLPPRSDLVLTATPARLGGWALSTDDGAGTIEITAAFGGTATIGWLGVAPNARGRGLGATLLHSALRFLADHGATDVVLDVDDDEPGGERDRSSADELYDRTGFTQVDRLHSYRRPGPS